MPNIDPVILRKRRRDFAVKCAGFDHYDLAQQYTAVLESGGEAETREAQDAARRELRMIEALGEYLYPGWFESFIHREALNVD